MDISRIRLSQILESQIPDFINDEFPLFKDFLRQYFEANDVLNRLSLKYGCIIFTCDTNLLKHEQNVLNYH